MERFVLAFTRRDNLNIIFSITGLKKNTSKINSCERLFHNRRERNKDSDYIWRTSSRICFQKLWSLYLFLCVAVPTLWDRWLRGGVNRWVYFSYRRRFHRLNFPIILTFSVRPYYYEGQGWFRNPQIICLAYSSRTMLNSIVFALSILIDLDSQHFLGGLGWDDWSVRGGLEARGDLEDLTPGFNQSSEFWSVSQWFYFLQRQQCDLVYLC